MPRKKIEPVKIPDAETEPEKKQNDETKDSRKTENEKNLGNTPETSDTSENSQADKIDEKDNDSIASDDYPVFTVDTLESDTNFVFSENPELVVFDFENRKLLDESGLYRFLTVYQKTVEENIRLKAVNSDEIIKSLLQVNIELNAE
ncbi:MAG: hypothetical protein JXR95_02110 [Deltaproteobacteria bacterium]|nr:hypothetical protein [Deltaproteobacteria bacterium]